MNNQEAFNKVRAHLLKQMEQSAGTVLPNGDGNKVCLYRGPHGLACAVGCLIPDDQYREEFECQAVYEIIELVPALNELSLDLLTSLQTVHDSLNPDVWEARLARVAESHGLEVQP